MTDTPRLWDRRADETPKSYAAFLAYVALGARSVREAARQYHINTTSTGEISSVEDTTVRTWMGWSARHKWVSRSLARDEWIARTSDDQIVSNVTACKLALTTRGAPDGARRVHHRSHAGRSGATVRGSRACRTASAVPPPPAGVVCSILTTAGIDRHISWRRIVPGRNTLCSNASRPPSETLPLRGSAMQDARHVAISASDDGGAYRRPGEGAEVAPWGATRAEETATT